MTKLVFLPRIEEEVMYSTNIYLAYELLPWTGHIEHYVLDVLIVGGNTQPELQFRLW